MDIHPLPVDDRQPIGVDIDNVIAATDPKIRQLIKRYFGVVSTQSEITHWHYSASLPITLQDEQFVFEQFHNHACLDARLLPGARRSLAGLAARFQIYLITSRPPSTQAITLAWLHKKRLHYDQIFFLQDKTILAPQLAFVIEDRLDTALAFADLGVPVYLFDYPWNRYPDCSNIIRVRGWADIMDKLTQFSPIQP